MNPYINNTIQSIKNWKNDFKQKRIILLKKLILNKKSYKEILNAFSYKEMQKNHENFCPLYKENKLCHKIKNLNCYGCDCPFYEIISFTKKNHTFIGKCSKLSKKALYTMYSKHELFILDCSKCTLPHTSTYTTKFIKQDITKLTNKCIK